MPAAGTARAARSSAGHGVAARAAPAATATRLTFSTWVAAGGSPTRPQDPSALESIALGFSRREIRQQNAAATAQGVDAGGRTWAAQSSAPTLSEILRYTLFSKTPSANPAQSPGQSELGVVTGDLQAGPTGTTLAYAVVQQPGNGSADLASDGTYTYTPGTDLAHNGGTDTFTVTVDGGAAYRLSGIAGAIQSLIHSLAQVVGLAGRDTVTVTVSVSITAINHSPTVTGYTKTDPSPTGLITGTITATDPDADQLTFSGPSTSEGGGTVSVSVGGTFSYTPTDEQRHAAAADGAPSAVTRDSFTVSVTDGYGGSVNATVTLPVGASNAAPTITVVDVSDPADDGAVTVTYSVSDADNTESATPDVLVVGVTGSTSAQTLALNGDNTLTYVPTDAARDDAAGAGPSTDEITLTVTDGHGGSASATAIVTIAPPAGSGVPTAAITATDPDTGVTTGVITGRTGATELTYTITKTSLYGTASIDTDTGHWNFTPSVVGLVSAWLGNTTPTTSFTVTASDGQQDTPVTVTVPLSVSEAALIGALQRTSSTPSAVAVAPDGTLYVTDSGANTLSVIYPGESAIATTVKVGRNPLAVSVGSDGRVWVVNFGDNTVSVTDSTGNLVRTVAVGESPSALAFGLDGTAFVTNAADGTVAVINPITYAVDRTVAVGEAPTGIATGPDGRIYVANFGDGTISIVDSAADFATDAIILDGVNPYAIAVTVDGTIGVTDPLHNTVIVLTPTDEADETVVPAAAAVAAGGPDVVMTTSGHDSFALTALLLESAPTAVSLGLDESLLFTNSGASTLTSIDLLSLVTTITEVGAEPVGVASGSDGTIYVVSSGSDTVTTIDPDTGLTASIPVEVAPFTVSRGVNGEFIFVSNYDEGISVFPTPGSDGPTYVSAPWSEARGGAIALADVAVGANGNVFVGNQGAVDEYDLSGNYVQRVFDISSPSYPQTTRVKFGADGQLFTIVNGELFVDSRDTRLSTPGDYIYDIAVGPNGDLYAVALFWHVPQDDGSRIRLDSRLVVFDPTDDYSATLVPDAYAGGRIAVDGDGNALVLSGSGLDVINPETGLASTIPLQHQAADVSVGADGRIYLANTSDRSITVLNPDYTVDAVVPVGIIANHVALAADGNLYVSSLNSSSVVVVDSENYAISAVELHDALGRLPYALSLAVGSSGVFALASTNYCQGTGGACYSSPLTVNQITEWVPPPPPSDPEPDPDDPEPDDPADPGPASVKDLWDNVKLIATGNDNEGIFIQTVLDDQDNKTRMILYVGGTTGDVVSGDQSFLENLIAEAGFIKWEQKQAIEETLRLCESNSACGPVAEILIVGYSQGGIDAQNFADIGGSWDLDTLETWEGFPESPITTIVTFGSPIVDNPDVVTLHIQDDWDEVVNAEALARYLSPVPPWLKARLAEPRLTALWEGQVFHADSPTSFNIFKVSFDLTKLYTWLQVHTDYNTYQWLSDEFSATPDDAYVVQKEALARFLGGTVVDPNEPDAADQLAVL
ncbi:40-residue YVTN family beta-propeller repeat protein [Mycolicibacterium rhodesiae JS60]|nr:40-residue YVTN family beta-propeller repeat protein [Mycolicibacterium rhodesiae JS60]